MFFKPQLAMSLGPIACPITYGVKDMNPQDKLEEIKKYVDRNMSCADLFDTKWLIARVEQLQIALGHVHSCGRCEQCSEVATAAYTTGPVEEDK